VRKGCKAPPGEVRRTTFFFADRAPRKKHQPQHHPTPPYRQPTLLRPAMNCARSLTAHSVRPAISCSGPAALSRGLRVPAGSPTSAEKLRTIESMPFQTYQLALDVIRKDREEKTKAVARQRKKISLVVANSGDTPNPHRITELKQHLEYLQVQADINNPRVKYSFDRGICAMPHPSVGRWWGGRWCRRNGFR